MNNLKARITHPALTEIRIATFAIYYFKAIKWTCKWGVVGMNDSIDKLMMPMITFVLVDMLSM